MYAVIRTGGKQYKVEAGERLEVELVGADEGAEIELAPILLVDGDSVLATPSQLQGAVVKAKVVGQAKGPKIDGFIYKPKSNNRRRYGHRQHLSVLEITAINAKKVASSAKKTAASGEKTASSGDKDASSAKKAAASGEKK
jgi:large subunit ribosomal protein L21